MYEIDEVYVLNLSQVKTDIYNGIIECTKRGLNNAAKFLAELNYGIRDCTTRTTAPAAASNPASGPVKQDDIGITNELPIDNNDKNRAINTAITDIDKSELDNYYLAKSYFDCREYDRAAHFTKDCESPVPKFLNLYSMYMAKEKKRLDNLTDASNLTDSCTGKDLRDLLNYLKTMYAKRSLDAYGLYLYGVILKKLDLPDRAIKIFVESVNQSPLMWSSWLEMAPLISDKNKLMELNLPNHWMKEFFLGHCYIELFLNDDALKIFEDLQSLGFNNCIYVTSQMAIAYHNKRNIDKAMSTFQELIDIDPYRLENMDIYSNILFVKEMKTEMAHLAHKVVEIDKYRPETCCVVGNYYSMRAEHQKSVIYFQRALRLNPYYLSAWTLMGHEFMEMKNTNAAIQCYRKGIEVNKRDYRAWYGLGQSYEILKMPYYSLYYYKRAQELRPYDSRMLVAIGETYEKLDKTENALQCYSKACNVGDIEGLALMKLGNLYENLGDIKSAVKAYLEFCSDERPVVDKAGLYHAYMVLASYYESISNFEKASFYAKKCLDHDDIKAEARSLLKTIENKRASLLLAKRQQTEQTVDLTNDMSMDESLIISPQSRVLDISDNLILFDSPNDD